LKKSTFFICENVSGIAWRIVSGRIVMDRRVPVLVIATVMKDPHFNAGSRARHLPVFSSVLFRPAQKI
jgi:hypothetical protein